MFGLTKENKQNKYNDEDIVFEESLKKEWLITNGIGGYASSTIIGANTRRYHGLLVASLEPPAKRYLILSKLDECIEIDGNNYELYTNIGKSYISKGYLNQEKFEYTYFPKFYYKVQGIEIEKEICMEYGSNTVGVVYKIKNANKKIKFKVAPLLNFRDFHGMATDKNFDVNQEIIGTNVRMEIDNNFQNPIYMKLSEGKYIKHENDIFKNMFYLEEEKRGFHPIENQCVPGVFEVEIEKNHTKEISFICSLEELGKKKVQDFMKKETKRLEKVVQNSNLLKGKADEKKMLLQKLIVASDKFIVKRQNVQLSTIIAGYPWFLDWGRDSLISFEGLLLKNKRYDEAKEVLLMMTKDINCGLVPNGYSEYDNKPIYNSVDASLLLFEQVKKYLDYTWDYKFVKENLYEKMEDIIENYQKGIDLDNNNIYVDQDYLVSAGTEKTQNTWMDAKCGDIVVTPRNGKAVEINSLWYNALMVMSELALEYDDEKQSKKYKNLAKKTQDSFKKVFYNPKRKCLYDVEGDNRIRPNQLFSLSLTYPVINPKSEEAYNILNVVEKNLLNNYGLKTLAKKEDNYVGIYEGNNLQRDLSYHQGITWPWLLGLYYNALKNMIKAENKKSNVKKLQEKLNEFVETTEKTFTVELSERGCIGEIAEIYDSIKPYEPKGTIAQGWSVAEILRIVSEN